MFLRRAMPWIRGTWFYACNVIRFKRLGFPVLSWGDVYVANVGAINFGRRVSLARKAYIDPLDLWVGDNTWLGVNCFICGKVRIGNDVMLGPNVVIPGANHIIHNIDVPMVKAGLDVRGTVIEDDVWIGGNVVIVDGVTVGRGAVVAAGSVVTTDVPAYSIMAGVPARVVSSRHNKSEKNQYD
jgi:maltose O-acetyltransferase